MGTEKDIVRGYVRYLKLQRNMSGNTLDAYQRDLRKLLDYLEREEKDVREVTLSDLEQFSAGLHDIGIHADFIGTEAFAEIAVQIYLKHDLLLPGRSHPLFHLNIRSAPAG